jgi:hypothetical protein
VYLFGLLLWFRQSVAMDMIYENKQVPLGKLKILPPSMCARPPSSPLTPLDRCLPVLPLAPLVLILPVCCPLLLLLRATTEKAKKYADTNTRPIITDPYGIIHTQHVKYDANTRSYQVPPLPTSLPPSSPQRM